MEAFKSTLDEITGADLVLHVVDASSHEADGQMAAVAEVLDQIGAEAIPTVLVLNKADLVDEATAEALRGRFPTAQLVSARTGEGIQELVDRIGLAAGAADTLMDVIIPYSEGALVSLAHEQCLIISKEHGEGGTRLQMQVPAMAVERFAPYLQAPQDGDHLAR